MYYISQIIINFLFYLNSNTFHLANMEISFNFKCAMILVFYLCILLLSKYYGGKIFKSQNYFYQNLFTIKLFFSELLGRNCFCNIMMRYTIDFTNYRAETLYIFILYSIMISLSIYIYTIGLGTSFYNLLVPLHTNTLIT